MIQSNSNLPGAVGQNLEGLRTGAYRHPSWGQLQSPEPLLGGEVEKSPSHHWLSCHPHQAEFWPYSIFLRPFPLQLLILLSICRRMVAISESYKSYKSTKISTADLCFQPCLSLRLLPPLLPSRSCPLSLPSTLCPMWSPYCPAPRAPDQIADHAGICSSTSQWTSYSSHLETLRGSHWLSGNSGWSSLWGQGDKGVASEKIPSEICPIGSGASVTMVGDSSGDQDKDCFDLVFRLLATISREYKEHRKFKASGSAKRLERKKKIRTGITTAEQIWGTVYGSELRIKNLDTLATWRPSSLKQTGWLISNKSFIGKW